MPILAATWKLEVERGPDWLLVRVGGSDVDTLDMPPLAQPLWAILEQHFVYRLVLQLDDVPPLTSELLGQLLVLEKRILEHDGVLRLCGLSPRNQLVLRSHGLDTRFPCSRNFEEAVMSSRMASAD